MAFGHKPTAATICTKGTGMRIGIVDTIFSDASMEEVLERSARLGYGHVEVSAWPKIDAEEADSIRLSNSKTPSIALSLLMGITRIDVDELDDAAIAHILECQERTGVEISALSFYGNPLDSNPTIRKRCFTHLENMIYACKRLGIGRIDAYIGRDPDLNNEENINLAIELWRPIIKCAEMCQVKIAAEPSPFFFTSEQWPAGLNIFNCPKVWREFFEAIPSDYFGLCYDPSHLVWQHMNPYKPIREFADKIFCVHIKDAKVIQDKLDQVGILAYPLEYFRPVLPGYGDINWGKFFSELSEIGFDGCAYVEIGDEMFAVSDAAIDKALTLTLNNVHRWVI